jgi:hypothetical protein
MTKDGERHLRAVHEDWRAVAVAINTRMLSLRRGQQEVALAAGVSVATVRVLQRGDRGRRAQNTTLSAVSRALGWPDDHLVRVLLGDSYPESASPVPCHEKPPTPVSLVKAPLDVPTRILLTLRRIERGVDDIAEYLARP